MGIGQAGTILAPALFILNLPLALVFSAWLIAYGSGGRVEDFACVDVGQCKDGSVGVSFVGGGLENDQWGQ